MSESTLSVDSEGSTIAYCHDLDRQKSAIELDESFEQVLLTHHYVPDHEPAPYTVISDDEEDSVVNIVIEGHSESAVLVEQEIGQSEDFDVTGHENSIVAEGSSEQTHVSNHIPDPVELHLSRTSYATLQVTLLICLSIGWSFSLSVDFQAIVILRCLLSFIVFIRNFV